MSFHATDSDKEQVVAVVSFHTTDRKFAAVSYDWTEAGWLWARGAYLTNHLQELDDNTVKKSKVLDGEPRAKYWPPAEVICIDVLEELGGPDVP